ncbi:MAG: DUF1295 domain-containing protein [Bacteroidaceae bacterium]|nr:DUF1295 domain-containing protein [Bacteroidaceae bacterium]
MMEIFDTVLCIVAIAGAVVFFSLYFVDAGYGKLISGKWGPTIPSRLGWIVMESPVFFVMLVLWWTSDVRWISPYVVFLFLFELHYFHRSFVFPLRNRGNSRMPLAIVFMSILFNMVNGYIQGWWIFRIAPELAVYQPSWLISWKFLAGITLFFAGMLINRHSDEVVRNLRKPGDTSHYFPKTGLYRYVTSANYFGEIIEWLGWAVLTWSMAGLVFCWFTCANLVPRANAIYHHYEKEFPEEFDGKRLKRVFPFIY